MSIANIVISFELILKKPILWSPWRDMSSQQSINDPKSNFILSNDHNHIYSFYNPASNMKHTLKLSNSVSL